MMHGYGWFGNWSCPSGFGYFSIWHFMIMIGVIIVVIALIFTLRKEMQQVLMHLNR